jgi:two-component system cell cycle response regulator DivK
MANELILIVEDDPKSRKLLRDVLSYNGYRLLESENAEEGVRLARENGPALILMDIHLPGMSGIEALHVLRGDPGTNRIPVVAVTASVMSQDLNEAMGAGFDAFERKPINIAGLLKTMRNLLERTRPA